MLRSIMQHNRVLQNDRDAMSVHRSPTVSRHNHCCAEEAPSDPRRSGVEGMGGCGGPDSDDVCSVCVRKFHKRDGAMETPRKGCERGGAASWPRRMLIVEKSSDAPLYSCRFTCQFSGETNLPSAAKANISDSAPSELIRIPSSGYPSAGSRGS